MISLTRTAALELAAYGVRVNAVCPGPVYTAFNRTVMAQRCASLGITEDEMIERVRAAIPLGRWGEAGDIARVVAFLCGPEAAWDDRRSRARERRPGGRVGGAAKTRFGLSRRGSICSGPGRRWTIR